MRFPIGGTRTTTWNGWHVTITALVTLLVVLFAVWEHAAALLGPQI